eukprot:scaffold22663_cov111-Cylindrotheca_fusiformis.AAC.4
MGGWQYNQGESWPIEKGCEGTIGWGIGLSGKRWGGVIKYRGGGTQLRSTVGAMVQRCPV